MRYLNKIVFINSAHVPYAEIKLDGNVHFIGTQGVGKSTLLRAILFFYNVDKGKLGIRTQDKQKSYDEFYFPYPNSYIIYEVCRETGTFFVMTFLSRGRAAFRIVDCPYDRRFFVEEDGSVRYEWGRISEQIGTRVFKSNIIRGYEEFRDILYGNQHVAPGCFGGELLRGGVEAPFPPYIQRGVAHNLDSRTIQALDCGQIAGEGGGHNHDKASSRTRAAGRADNLGPNKKAPHAAGLAYQMVEMKGVEPSASAMRRQRSPN